MLQARLAKVRQRKMKKSKLDGTEEEQREEENEGWFCTAEVELFVYQVSLYTAF